MNETERRKAINELHKGYSHQIAEIYQKDLLGSTNVVDRTIAFLMALENVKISTMESLTAANVHLKIERMLDSYSKSKKAVIELNRKTIERQVKEGKFIKDRPVKESNSMYR